MMRTPESWLVVVAGVWLGLFMGLLTNLVTDVFPPFLEPVRPWLLPVWLMVGGAITLIALVELRRRKGSRLGDPVPTDKERADALGRIRTRVSAELAEVLAAEEPLDLAIEGADSLLAAYEPGQSVLVLGATGSGKSTELWRLADVLAQRAQEDDKNQEPLPVVLSLAGWGRQQRRPRLVDLIPRKPRDEEPQDLLEWLLDRAWRLYGIRPGVAREWLRPRAIVLLLDGLDEVRDDLRERCVRELNELLADEVKPFVVLTCRTAEHQGLKVKPAVRRTVTVAPLSEEQVSQYVALDDDLRKVVDAPLWLRLAKEVSSRIDTSVGPDQLRRLLLDAYVTELLNRGGGDRIRLLRRLGLLARLTRRTADPDRVDPRVLTGLDAPVAAELVAALRAWVLPPAVAGVLVTGLVLPLLLWFGLVVGIAGGCFAVVVALFMGWISYDSRYAVDLVAGRPLRVLVGVVAGLVLGVVVGGVAASVSGVLGVLPTYWRTLAIGVLVGVAVTVSGDRLRVEGGLASAAAVVGVVWLVEDLRDPDFQRILLVTVLGMTGSVAVAMIAGGDTTGPGSLDSRVSRRPIAVTVVLVGVTIEVAGAAGAPVDGPLGAAIGGFVVSLLGFMVAGATGAVLAILLLTPLVHRAGLAWTGLLPTRLRPVLRDAARRGLLTATGDGFRFLHGLLRDHIARIDALDGRPSEPAHATEERETALARLDALLTARRRPRVWIPPRLTVDGEPCAGPVQAFTASGGRLAIVGKIGAGTSTLLLEIAESLLAEARAEPWRPVPVYVDLAAMPSRIEPVDGVVRPFTRWLAAQLRLRYGISVETTLAWLADRRLVLLLDGHGHGQRAARNAAMVREFVEVYDVPVVAAGWADTPSPLPGPAVTVEPLTRDEVVAALTGQPRVVEFLGADRRIWAALDTVDRIQLVTDAAASTDPVRSYVDGRFDGLPTAARLWYSGLTGKAKDVTEKATHLGVLLPAAMVAITLVFGLGLLAGIVTGLATGLMARPPLVKPVGRVIALVLAIAFGFAWFGIARVLGEHSTTSSALKLGLVLGCYALVAETWLPASRLPAREWAPYVFPVVLYLLFDGHTRIGASWSTLLNVGWGAVLCVLLFVGAMILLFAVTPLIRVWAGVRPLRRRRIEHDLIARRLVFRTKTGLHADDPLVERAVSAPEPA